MAIHEHAAGKTDEWYTPPHVFDSMGVVFDWDVASPGVWVTPWIPAKDFITKEQDALDPYCVWQGFVWMNPPFGGRNAIVPWLQKFFEHRNGIALVPDRTSAPWWQRYVPNVDAVLFVSPKIKFLDVTGKPGDHPGQGTCLLALGDQGVEALWKARQNGLGAVFSPGQRSPATLA